MNIFIDCEFNGFGGQLMSMALVAEDGREFYEVLPLPLLDDIDPFHNFKLIADWPDDKGMTQAEIGLVYAATLVMRAADNVASEAAWVWESRNAS